MSGSASFMLTSSDGRLDHLLIDIKRIQELVLQLSEQQKMTVYRKRQEMVRLGQAISREATAAELLPNLSDIHARFLIHTHKEVKPYVAINIEDYNVRPSSGNPAFGQHISFKVPQYGDFFAHTMFNCKIDAVQASSGVVPVTAADSTGLNNLAITEDSFISRDGTVIKNVDQDLLKIRSFERLGYFQDGNSLVAGAAIANQVKYVDFPGERLLEKTRMTVNGNELDRYNYMSYVFYRQFELDLPKKHAYNKGVGQSAARLTQEHTNGSISYQHKHTDGYQTPKDKQPELHLLVPLLFWFSLDYQQAFPSVAVPFGQRDIEITLASLNHMIKMVAPMNLHIKVFEQVYPTGTVFPSAVNGVYTFPVDPSSNPAVITSTHQMYQVPTKISSSVLSTPSIQDVRLIMQQIFMLPDVVEVYAKMVGFQMIKLHQPDQAQLTQQKTIHDMATFRFPVEFFYIGVIPNDNLTEDNYADHWHQFEHIKKVEKFNGKGIVSDAVMMAGKNDGSILTKSHKSVISKLKIETSATSVYDDDFKVYNVQKGLQGKKQQTNKDNGVALVNFGLDPFEYQPSGYANFSRMREFKATVELNPDKAGTYGGTLFMEARFINYLFIQNGGAVIRFAG